MKVNPALLVALELFYFRFSIFHSRFSIFRFPFSSRPYLLDMKVTAIILLKTGEFNPFKTNDLALYARYI
jgi:hypothetical protein